MIKKSCDINGIKFDLYKDSTVFGDGEHETTKFILELMQKCGVKDKRVLDIGTGTGILSIFASLSGASHVFAVDISASALEWARKNFKHNNVDVEVEINDKTLYLDEKADIVLSNLPPAVQVENMHDVKGSIAEDGILIISWYKEYPFERFVKGFEVLHHIEGEVYDAYALKPVTSEVTK